MIQRDIPTASDLDEGFRLFEQRDYAGAKAELEAALVTQPTNPQGWHKLGELYLYGYGPLEKAIECFELAVKYAPDNSDYRAFLGEACGKLALRNGRNLKALNLALRAKGEFQLAFERNPESPRARRALMEYYAQAPPIAGGSWDEAERIAKETLNTDPATAYRMLASLHCKKEEKSQAEEYYVMAIKEDPKSLFARVEVGWFYFGEKQYDKALIQFQKYQELKPQDPAGFANLGRFYVLIQEFDKAEAHYQKAIEMQPKYVEAWYRLGSIYARKGEEAKAKHAFQKCVLLDGNSPFAHLVKKQEEKKEKKDRAKKSEGAV